MMPYWASSCSSRWLKASHGQMTVMSAGEGASMSRRFYGPAAPSGPCCPHPKWLRPSSQDTPALGGWNGHPTQEGSGCSRLQGREGRRWALLRGRGQQVVLLSQPLHTPGEPTVWKPPCFRGT